MTFGLQEIKMRTAQAAATGMTADATGRQQSPGALESLILVRKTRFRMLLTFLQDTFRCGLATRVKL